MDNVCNRSLFSIPSKVEMAEEQEYFWFVLLTKEYWWLKNIKESVVEIFVPWA